MKRVAVIGAGASGLCAVKCCLEEGLRPVCFEKTDDIGGLWKYKPEVIPDQGCVMKSTITNTSKEITCFSDFPMPREFPIYPHNSYIQKYFRLYADNFGLLKHIQFGAEVIHVKCRSDFDQTGQWDVRVKRKDEGIEDLVFDAVLVCNGHNWSKYIPSFPGLDRFQGEIIHSRDYKDLHGYDGKKVVVIGLGNSGGDAAAELSLVASQVFLSTRDGAWVVSRVSLGGMPFDMVAIKRMSMFLKSLVPTLVDRLAARMINGRLNHVTYGLQSGHSVSKGRVVVNDELPSKLISGAVVLKPNVEEFTSTGVRFDDGTFEDNVDVVLFATGYNLKFPFLDKSVLEVKKNEVELFKYMFPQSLTKSTLAVISCLGVGGPTIPISEMQNRLATRVFTGKVTLPSQDTMVEMNKIRTKKLSEEFPKWNGYVPVVNFISYLDELADLIGCRPNIGKLLLTDPRLALTCWFSACTPYQFRLQGPGAWAGARHAILTQWERTLQPLQTRPVHLPEQRSSSTFYILAGLCLFVVVILAWCS